MKTTAATIPPPDDRRTLLDEFRRAGLANDLISEMNRRLEQRARRRRRAARGALAAVTVIAALAWAVPYFRHTSTLATPAAERRSLALADGSRAELNARTEFTADFRYGRRTVRLERGEIFLSVAKDAAHPFVVETPGGAVRVTGTQFNVRLDREGRAEVTLVEGAVEVERPDVRGQKSAGSGPTSDLRPPTSDLRPPSSVLRLTPGQQLVFGGATAESPRHLDASGLERALAWRQGKIVLDDLRLADAAARFAEFHGREIRVDLEAADVRLGGTYSLENLPAFFEALDDTGTLKVLRAGEGVWRIVRR
jgi:transmembrane sensor